jgi:Ring finger domain
MTAPLRPVSNLTKLCLIANLIWTAVVFGNEWSTPCERPLRFFLVGTATLPVAYTLLDVAAGLPTLDEERTPAQRGASWASHVVAVGTLGWIITGCAWVFPPSNCREVSPWTHSLAAALCLLALMLVAGNLLFSLCFVCAVMARPDSQSVDSPILPSHRGASAPELKHHLTVLTYSDDLFDDVGDQTCGICLCEYEEGDRIHLLPCPGTAMHAFHAACVSQWLARDRTCPVCKHDITDVETPVAPVAPSTSTPSTVLPTPASHDVTRPPPVAARHLHSLSLIDQLRMRSRVVTANLSTRTESRQLRRQDSDTSLADMQTRLQEIRRRSSLLRAPASESASVSAPA